MPPKPDYSDIPQETPVMFHSIDGNGRLIDVSNQWLEVLGYRRDEVIGRLSTEFLTEESRRYAEEVVLPAFFRTGFCTDIPYQMVTRSGQVLDILLSATAERNEQGETVRSFAVLVDVTKRKQEERALRDSKEILSRAFEASGAMLIISTLDTGTVLEVNDAFERLLGYRRQEVVGRESSALQIWENQKDRSHYVKLLREQGKVRDIEVRLRAKSGESVVGLLTGEVLEVNGEKCLLSIVNDITDRKRAAEELEVLHTNLASHALALEVANEELEAFSYTVSHDLRKPLTAISGYCQVLLELCGNQANPECRTFLREIVKGAIRMSQFIEALLEFSHLSHSELHKGVVDLSALAADAVAELRVAEPQRNVEVKIQEGMRGEGDATLLRVVLDNLFSNAWKYTAKREKAVIEFGSRKENDETVYFVRDNGAGFDSAGAERLFTAFHRQHGAESFKGHGIGLATVKRIINRHGGRVWAEGERDVGAVFYFTIE